MNIEEILVSYKIEKLTLNDSTKLIKGMLNDSFTKGKQLAINAIKSDIDTWDCVPETTNDSSFAAAYEKGLEASL